MKNRNLSESFANAFRGIKQAYKTERNVRLDFFAAFIAITLAIILDFTRIEFALLIITIIMVIVTELLNTAVEYAVDLVCGDKFEDLAKYAKDIAAGAALVVAIGAVIMACILFIPKIF